MTGDARCDVAVVMARGASRRMGQPKGLCRLPGDVATLLQRVVALHRGAGRPVAVVTLPQLWADYAGVVDDAGRLRWILAPPGGGTATTALAALRALPEATHLWLHPVDLPGVRPATCARLAALSAEAPGAIIAPVHAGRPGHPVLLPAQPFRPLAERLGSGPLPGAMRDLLRGDAAPAPLHRVAVDDPGVIDDFDSPEDLAAAARRRR